MGNGLNNQLRQWKEKFVAGGRFLTTSLEKRRIISKIKSSDRGIIVHYTPDFSGGGAAHIVGIIDALPDFTHIVVSKRRFEKPWSSWLKNRVVYSIGMTFSPDSLKFLDEVDPVVIFNHISWDLEPVRRNWLKGLKRPKVVSFMHSRGLMHRLDLDHADKVVIFSRYLEDSLLEARYCPEDHSSVVRMPNCINEVDLIALPLSGQFRSGRFAIGNIGNGAKWKHSDDFLDICESIEIPNVLFKFLGANDLQDAASGNMEILPLFSVSIPDYMSQISILIHKTRPDVAETWCRTVTEAMFAGVPVVAEARGGVREQIVHGKTGFLCNTAEEYKKWIESLFFDEALYRKISHEARQYAKEHFSLAESRHNLLSLLCSKTDDMCKA